MTRRAVVIGMLGLALATAGCGSTRQVTTRSQGGPTPAQPSGPLVLAQFDEGVGAVTGGSSAPVWTDPEAVAALDGSAVFSTSVGANREHGDPARLVRLDARTGVATTSWPIGTGLSISAVAPEGRWIALTNRKPGYGAPQGLTATRLVVFDATAGAQTHRLELRGDVQPEAFSVDGRFVYALDFRGDHYRVQTINLTTGERYDTGNRDKAVSREDMHGTSVRGVMNADRTLLATLYRNPGDADEPAFVHILDLEHGWAYCADLAPPFGTGPPGSDLIELTPTGTVIVAATRASRLAEIHIDEVHTPSTTPVTVELRAGTITPTEPAFRSTPGFGHVIAVVPT